MYTYNLQFSSTPPDSFAGFYNQTPFFAGLTTNNPNYDELRVNFFAQDSQSAPFQVPQNKWSHLVPQWRFLNYKGEVIEYDTPDLVSFTTDKPADPEVGTIIIAFGRPQSLFIWTVENAVNGFYYDLSVSDSLQFTESYYVTTVLASADGVIPFFNSNTEQQDLLEDMGLDPFMPFARVGISDLSKPFNDLYVLQVSAYYIDDLPADVDIIFTLETSGLTLSSDNANVDLPSYSNSLIFDEVEYTVKTAESGLVKVTQDGKNDIDKFKWTNTLIPFVASIQADEDHNYSGKKKANIYGLSAFPIKFDEYSGTFNFTVSGIDDGNITWDQASSVELSAVDEYGFPYGGFYKGYFSTTVSSVPTRIDAFFSVGSVSGNSVDFNIKNLERPYEIRRFNESWDTAGTMKSFALPEHLFNNPVLFDNFLEVAVGGVGADHQSIGRTLYERIANFVKNNDDIEISNVDQFYSILKMMDIPFDDYRLSYPAELERLVDMFSINKKKLMGEFCKCNRNFLYTDSECAVCGHFHALNRSTDGQTSEQFVVSAGMPFVVENVYAKNDKYRFDLVYPFHDDIVGTDSLVVSGLSSVSWIPSADYHKYTFYEYISTFCGNQEEGVINWGDTYTTLSSSISSLDEWYGDEKLIEEMLNYEIHRGLYNE